MTFDVDLSIYHTAIAKLKSIKNSWQIPHSIELLLYLGISATNI